MAVTPFAARALHFQDISMSSIGSPLSAAAPDSLDFLNSQLVAHGFAHGNGLNLTDMRGRDQQQLLKCLSNMLGQRVDDISRTEQLAAKYKTLSYEHESLLAQYHVAKELAAHSERELETNKAKLDGAQRKLVLEEESHRKSRDEFQKLKTSMQYLRTTSANEGKRKEKEIEKVMERWSKVCNEQVRLGSIGAGLVCSNLLTDSPRSPQSDIWDAALADSEAARLRLLRENDGFRDIVLACSNALQSACYSLQSLVNDNLVEPDLILPDALFASHSQATQADSAQIKLQELFGTLKYAVDDVARAMEQEPRVIIEQADPQELLELQEMNTRLIARIDELELVNQNQGQSLLEQFVSDMRFVNGQNGANDYSMELISAPEHDQQAESLEKQRQLLEEERLKFTEATIKLGRDKAALEAERLLFIEQKRTAELQAILEDLPPTPPVAKALSTRNAVTLLSTTKSSLSLSTDAKHGTSIERASSIEKIQGQDPPIESITTQSQSIPPPSDKPQPLPPMPNLVFDWPAPSLVIPPANEEEPQKSKAFEPSKAKETAASLPPHLRTQKTPVRPTVFPLSKPQHKYSPAVPSPLSRIAVMADSPPASPESKAQLDLKRPAMIPEEDEELELAAENLQSIGEGKEPPELQNSVSPLSRIRNMGMSPAIAPLMSVSSFPGLLGSGTLANTGLLTKPASSVVRFGAIPNNFRGNEASKAPAPLAKEKVQAKKVILGDNKVRSSKESTVVSIKPTTKARVSPELPRASGVREKENTSTRPTPAPRVAAVKKSTISGQTATARPAARPPVKKVALSGGTVKSTAPKGWKG